MPQRAGFPVGGETHFQNEIGIHRMEQPDEACRPIRRGFDAGHQVHEKNKGVMNLPLLLRHCRIHEKVWEEVGWFLFGQFEFEDESAVPKPRVVGGAISQDA